MKINVFITSTSVYKNALKLSKSGPGIVNRFMSGQAVFDEVRQLGVDEMDIGPVIMLLQVMRTEKITKQLNDQAQTISKIINSIPGNTTKFNLSQGETDKLEKELEKKDRLVVMLVRLYFSIPVEHQRNYFLQLLKVYCSKAIIKFIAADNVSDAKAKVDQLRVSLKAEIKNIIIDSHGYYPKTGFYIGDKDKFFFDGSVRVYSSSTHADYAPESAEAIIKWKQLSQLLNFGTDSVVLNACYGGNDRKSWTFKKAAEEKLQKYFLDVRRGTVSPATYTVTAPARDEGEMLVERLYKCLKQPGGSKAHRNVYASKSWFMNKPGVMLNIPLVEIQTLVMALSATQMGRDLLTSFGDFSMDSVKKQMLKSLRDEMGIDDMSSFEQFFVGNIPENIVSKIESTARNILGQNPFDFSFFELLAYGILPRLYYTLPLVVTPGGIDEPDYYLLGANVGGHYISEMQEASTAADSASAYYRRYEWENAGQWVRSAVGEHRKKTFIDISRLPPAARTAIQNTPIGQYTNGETENGFYTEETGTLIYYYNGDFSVFDKQDKIGINNWHGTLLAKLWTNVAHQISLDSEFGLAKSARKKPTIKKYTEEEAKRLKQKTSVEYFLTPDFFES